MLELQVEMKNLNKTQQTEQRLRGEKWNRRIKGDKRKRGEEKGMAVGEGEGKPRG